MRDDFTKQTIIEIAKGVCSRCSNPECDRPTDAANAAQDGTITIGVAAHICAASPGGPRYNAQQTSEARRAAGNGIWLCQNCARLVDADPAKYTVEVLQKWKDKAQKRAFRALVAQECPALPGDAGRIDMAFASGSTTDPDSAELFARVHAAVTVDLGAYKRGQIWSGAAVELTLRLFDESSAPPFNIGKLPLAIEAAPEVTILSSPGTGKTITLLQLAGHLLSANSIIPLYFRLGDWSAGSLGLLQSLVQRPALSGLSLDDLRKLAQHGRVALLLDGWNELDPGARRRLRVELEQIRRDWPYVRIVATTRQQMLDVPLSGPHVVIEPLSHDQQMAIARAQSGALGEKTVDEAWRTPGVRELIAIPLYLSALLAGVTQGKQATTKEEILRLFVQQHERAGDHAESLNAVLLGCHTEILMALAGHLNSSGATSMSEADARKIVASTIARLREQGQITGHPEPFAVLEVLTSHHILMRSGTDSGTVAFQHQQFQEWFASYEVAELMRGSARGDASMRVRLRGAILNQPAWEESIYFAVERLSREAGGAAVVAHAVRLALAIDPMLAAEMIYRSSSAVWNEVASEIISFVDRWHAQESVDRAVRFMIITGRPEFERLIWPLASNDDRQSQLPMLRSAPHFRPSVLGSDIRSKIPTLPEETRHDLLALIASESGVDGMDLATELAEADPSPKVQADVVQNLQFRRADRHVARLLAKAHDETWSLVARRGYAEEVSDPATAARLRVEREKALARATEPLERLRLFLEQSADYEGRDAGIAAAIADPRFPIREPNNGASLYYAHQRTPAATLRGLRQRLDAGLALPFHADEMLKQLEPTDEGPIPDAILDASNDERQADTLAVMAGPKTVEALVDKFVTSADALSASRNDRRLSDEHGRLRRRIANTRASLFIKAILNRAGTADQAAIMSLADLISSHGNDSDRNSSLQIEPADKPALIDILRSWVNAVISAPDGARYALAYVASAIGRCGFPELVPELKRLLDEDLARLTLARTEQAMARRRGRAAPYDTTGYNNHYGNALSRIGTNEAARVLNDYLENPVFGLEAAFALKAISDKQLGLPGPNPLRHWPPFDDIYAARAARSKTQSLKPLNAIADPIFAAIDWHGPTQMGRSSFSPLL